jgi:hypothetical protein
MAQAARFLVALAAMAAAVVIWLTLSPGWLAAVALAPIDRIRHLGAVLDMPARSASRVRSQSRVVQTISIFGHSFSMPPLAACTYCFAAAAWEQLRRNESMLEFRNVLLAAFWASS